MSMRMKKSAVLSFVFALVFTLFTPLVPQAWADESGLDGGLSLFVATDGNDNTGDGTEASPFQTLDKARDYIRSLKAGEGLPDGGVTVNLRGGDYPILGQSFDLTTGDSGTADSPIIYRSYPGETARLVGGKSLDASEFAPVTEEAIRSRLPEGVADQVVEINLLEQGITSSEYGTIQHYGQGWPLQASMMELFVESKEMQLGRYPNDGWLTMSSIVNAGTPGNAGGVNQGPTFVYNDPQNRASNWSAAEDVWMFGYYFYDWAEENMKVGELDAAANTVKGLQSAWWGINPDLSHRRFYFYNLLEEIDQPGEWYLNRTTGKLYLYPPAGFNADSSVQLSFTTQPLIRTNDTSHVHIRGLELGVTRGTGIRINGGSHMLIADNRISNTGMFGVDVRGGNNHGVTGNEIFDTGTGGVITEGGHRASLTPSGHYVLNNHIHSYSRIKKTYSPGIRLDGVGTRAAYNVIHDSPHYAINFSGNDHIIEYNEIFDVLQDSNDSGAIYAARDYSYWGNVIRYNYMHDIVGREGHNVRGVAVYVDDNVSGTEVYGNIMVNVGIPFYTHGGRSNKIYENIIINPLYYYVRGIKYGGQAANVPGYAQDSLTRLMAMPYDTPLWRSKYPEMMSIIEDSTSIGIIDPKFNEFTNNIILNGHDAPAQLHTQLTTYGNFDGNYFVDVDTPEDTFMDWVNGDYRIKPDAELYDEISYYDSHQDRSGLLPVFLHSTLENDLARVLLMTDQPLFNSSSIYAEVGGSVQLNVRARSVAGEVIPVEQLTVLYESSNSAIASVNATTGVVNAIAEGTTTLTATVTKDGVSKSIVTTLTVGAEAPKLHEVKLELDRATLEIGNIEKAVIRWFNQYNQLLDLSDSETTFTSENPEIVSIADNGVITALAVGSSVIQATTVYGGETVSTSEIEIKVVNTELSSVTATVTPGFLEVGQTAELQVRANLSNDTTITPTGGQLNITIEDTEVINFNDDGNLVGLKAGKSFIDIAVTYQGVTMEKKVHLSVFESTTNNVPEPWRVITFSSTGRSGFAKYDDGMFRIVSNADSFLEGADNVTMVNRLMPNSAVRYTISGTLHSLENIDPGTSAGLVIRGSNNEAGSKASALQVTSEGKLQLINRTVFNAGNSVKEAAESVTFPVELKLEKRLDTNGQYILVGYVRKEGAWVEMLSQGGFTFGGEMNAGMTLVSHSHKGEAVQTTEALFSNLVVEQGEVSKLSLSDVLIEAKEVHRNAVEGTGDDQYPYGSKAELMTAIQSAQATLDNAAAAQGAIDSAEAALTQALQDFEALMGTGEGHQDLEWPEGSELTVGAVTANSVALNWTAALGDISAYRITWDGGSVEVPGNTLIHVVEGLDPNTGYTFQIQAQAGGQWSANGPQVTAQTSEQPTPEPSVPTAVLSGNLIAAPEQTVRVSYSLSGVAMSEYPTIFAQDLEFAYDADALEFVNIINVREGLNYLLPEDQQPGVLQVGLASEGPANAVTGDGKQFDLVFKVIANETTGSTTVRVVKAELADHSGNIMSAIPTDHVLEVRDINLDDLVQLIATAQHLHDEAVEGTWRTQYAVGSKAQLLAAILLAAAVAADEQSDAGAISDSIAALGYAVNEFNLARNNFAAGDIDGNGVVNVGDLGILAYYYGLSSDSLNWNEAKFADLNDDGVINVFDLSEIARRMFQ